MPCERDTIIFTLSHEGRNCVIQTPKNKYESLMCLISDYIMLTRFGICYGGGSCNTCGVLLKEKGSPGKKFILSCEVKIDENLTGKSVIIL